MVSRLDQTWLRFDGSASTRLTNSLPTPAETSIVSRIAQNIIEWKCYFLTLPKLLDNYTGRYHVTPNPILEISRDGDRLFAQAFVQLPHNRLGDLIGGPKFELFAEGEKDFFARVADHQITFETGPDGRATGIILRQAGRPDMPGARLS